MTRSVRRLLVGIDQVAAIIYDARAAGIDQGSDAGFLAGTDDVARSFHIDPEKQFLVSLSHRGNRWRSRMDDNGRLHLLEDVDQRCKIGYIPGMVAILKVGSRTNIEEVDLAFGMAGGK